MEHGPSSTIAVESSANEQLTDLERLALQDKIADPTYLPTFAELQQAFTTEAEWQEFKHRNRTVESMHEFLCQEYVEQLVKHLIEMADAQGATADHPLQVLETGAGDGRLTAFIQQALPITDQDRIHLVATDAGKAVNSQDTWSIEPVFPVEKVDYQTALASYKPNIVITSWMPPRQDWTRDYRHTESVQEYLLIGPTDSDRSGDTYYTWGQLTEIEVSEYGTKPYDPKPYEREGFTREQLLAAERWEAGGNDSLQRLTDDNFHLSYSGTTVFRRTAPSN